MRDDARFLSLLFGRAPRPGNKVHQTLVMDDFFHLSNSTYELQISFTLR